MVNPLRDPVRGSSTAKPTGAAQRLPDDMSDQELAQLAFDRLFGSRATDELSDEQAMARMTPLEEGPELSDEAALARMTPEPTQTGQAAQTRVGMIPAFAVGSAVQQVPQTEEQPVRAEQLQPDPMQLDRERAFNFMQRSQAAGTPVVPEQSVSQVRKEIEDNPELFAVYSEYMMQAEEQMEKMAYDLFVLQQALQPGEMKPVGE